MKKIITIFMILLIIVLISIPLKNVIATEEFDANISLETTDILEAGKEITISIKISDIKSSIDTVIGVIEYDKNIFEEIIEDDFVPEGKWNYPMYNAEDGIFMVDRTEPINEDGIIVNIKLKTKENITATNTIIKLTDIEVAGLGQDLKVNKEIEIMLGETKEENGEETEDRLYLSTEVYKIGNNDINNFETGDEYISRITKETILTDFINNLDTNGQLTVIKEDGTELTENEFVGTGMTVISTKDESKIELKIAVSGDLSGDGKVTATDLSTLNQTILNLITLDKEFKMAADLDENETLTATDLSTLNKMLLKIL